MQHIDNITLTQLQYIIAIDTYKHFAIAAEHCNVTQPTLSMQVKKAEEQLGVILFDRSKQPILTTAVGEDLVRQGRIILREAGKISDIIQQHQQQVAGDLTVGIIPTLAPYLVPYFAGNFARAYPALHVHIKELMTKDIIAQLRNDKIDAGILVSPVAESDIIEKELFWEEIKVYAHPARKFEKKKSVSLSEVAASDIWLLSEGHCFRSQVVNLCAYHSARLSALPVSYESGSLDTIIRLIDMEGGFTLLPELAVLELPEERQERVLEFEGDKKPVRQISMVYARSFAKERVLSLLAESIIASVPRALQRADRGKVVEWK